MEVGAQKALLMNKTNAPHSFSITKRERGGLVKLPFLLLEATPPSYYWSTETD